jgi:hypothetical protein
VAFRKLRNTSSSHFKTEFVGPRNLRNTSDSHFKTAEAGRSCKVWRRARHNFLRAPGRAGGRQAKKLLGWVASSKPTQNNSPKDFPRRAFRCPRPHGTAALVASRNLRNTSSSHVETAAAGRSFKGRCGGAHVFPRARGRAGGRQAKELLGWIPSSVTKSQHLAKTFPAKSISTVQGHTGLLHLSRHATFGTLRILT